MRESWVFLCGLLLLLLQTADGFKMLTTHRCVFNSSQSQDIQYINSFYYNKLEFIRFDSKVGWYVGFTAVGVKQAAIWNKDASKMKYMRQQKNRICDTNVPELYKTILSKSVEPYAVLNTAPSVGSDRVLVCSVYGFYPKDITVTWTNHKQQIHNGIITTDLLPDSDWYYQLHSHLEYTPRFGDQISCVIEHISLKEPMVLDYGGALSDGDRNRVIIAACGLFLGLVLSLAGFIYYRHKSRGMILVPNH